MIHKCPQISEQFEFKRSKMYKCLKKRCTHKSTLSRDPLAALYHHLWNCSNDMFKFSNCSYERSWNQLSRKKNLIHSSSGGWDMAIWKKYGRTFFMNLLGCAEKQSICFFAQSNAKKTWTLAKTAAKQPKMIRFRIFKCLWNHLIKPLPKTFLKISKTQKLPQKRTPQNYQNPKII